LSSIAIKYILIDIVVFDYILFPTETVRSPETPGHSSATVRINLKYHQLLKEVQKELVLKYQEGEKRVGEQRE